MIINFDSRMKNNTGIGVYVRELVKGYNSELNSQINYLDDNIKLFSIKEQLYLHKYNTQKAILHCPHFNAPVIKNGKLVITIHDLAFDRYDEEFINLKAKLYYKLIMNRNIKNADCIITISESTKKDILNFYNVDEERVVIIKHGLANINTKYDEDTKKEFFQKHNIDKPYILYVGINRPRKNLKRLILAYEKLIKETDFNLKLVIAGKKDNRYYNLEKEIKEKQMENSVVLTDFVTDDQLKCLYSNCKAFIFPSVYEGFGFPLLEAMKFKVPIICSNTSSIPEVVGDAGVYFNPFDVNDIAEKIYNTINNDELKKLIISKGSVRIKEFSWEESVKKHIEIYNKLWKGEL